jgi:hypothetical protein
MGRILGHVVVRKQSPHGDFVVAVSLGYGLPEYQLSSDAFVYRSPGMEACGFAAGC